MKGSAAAIITASTIGLGVMSPAVAAPDLPPTGQMSAQQVQRVGAKYLRIVCPANRAEDRKAKLWKSIYGKFTVPYGTPVPVKMRRSFQRVADANARAGQRLNAARWPEDLHRPISRIVRSYFGSVSFYESRTTPTARRSWQKRYYSAGGAATTVRIRLGLPPRGRGC
jgi:hypothetical protein